MRELIAGDIFGVAPERPIGFLPIPLLVNRKKAKEAFVMAEILRLSTVSFIDNTVSKQVSKTTLKKFIMEQHFHDRLTYDEVAYLFSRHQLRGA